MPPADTASRCLALKAFGRVAVRIGLCAIREVWVGAGLRAEALRAAPTPGFQDN